jgi:hypothetical protein
MTSSGGTNTGLSWQTLGMLIVAGIAFSLLATHSYISNIASLIPLMNTAIGTLAFRMFWFGIELWPITIAITLLRVEPPLAILTIVLFELLMTASVFAFEPWNQGEAFGLFIGFLPDLLLQLPVWLVTYLALRLTRR